MVTTVLTVYGIETFLAATNLRRVLAVTTVLTVYGIETDRKLYIVSNSDSYNSTYRLRYWNWTVGEAPFVGGWGYNSTYRLRYWNKSGLSSNSYLGKTVTTVLTVYGIETTR